MTEYIEERISALTTRIADLEITLTRLVNKQEPCTPDTGEGWRLLQKEETAEPEPDDEIWFYGKWHKINGFDQSLFRNYQPIRRRVPAEQPRYREPTRADLVEAWMQGRELMVEVKDRYDDEWVKATMNGSRTKSSLGLPYIVGDFNWKFARVRVNPDGTLHESALKGGE